MKIGIMGAMPEEVSGIIEQLDTSRMHRIGGREYLEGTWNGIDVVVVFSRWGKVAASVTATVLLSRFGVDGIFFIGVAGAADPGLRLGESGSSLIGATTVHRSTFRTSCRKWRPA